MKQQERQERSKKEILRAGMEEFGTSDYGTVTIESVCRKHGISKGMMYHYYSGKDELFLACVGEVFSGLRDYAQARMGEMDDEGDVLEKIKKFFMVREYYFETNPLQANIFANAVIHPPRHLEEQIQELRKPIISLNRVFIAQALSSIRLREGLDPDKAGRYLESMGCVFRSLLKLYAAEGKIRDIPSLLENTIELLDMCLFGVAR